MLDHIIAHRDITWLGAEHDKVAHFLTTTSLRREELPRLTFGRGADVTVRYFPDKLPIGVSLDGRSHVFLYLLSEPIGDDFRLFLRRHAELLRALPAWSIRLLVPTGVESEVADAYEAVFREELATPLHPTVANELRWFYQSADITGTVDGKLATVLRESQTDKEKFVRASMLRLQQQQMLLRSKLDRVYEDRLSDAIPEELWNSKSAALQDELRQVRTEMERHEVASQEYETAGLQILELAQTAYSSYVAKNPHEQARLIKTLVSNSTFDRGSLSPTYVKPFDVFAKGSETGDWLLRLDSNQQPSG